MLSEIRRIVRSVDVHIPITYERQSGSTWRSRFGRHGWAQCCWEVSACSPLSLRQWRVWSDGYPLVNEHANWEFAWRSARKQPGDSTGVAAGNVLAVIGLGLGLFAAFGSTGWPITPLRGESSDR